MSTAATAKGGAFDAAVITESRLDPDDKLAKLRGAVGYFEKELEAAKLGVSNAEAKSARLGKELDAQVTNAKRDVSQLEKDLKAAKAALTKAEKES